MRAKLEKTKNTEDTIRGIADEVQEEYPEEMRMLVKLLKKEEREGIQLCFQTILNRIVEFLVSIANENMQEKGWEVYECKDKMDCLVLNIIFESVYVGYPGGKTYKEFLKTVFRKAGITLSDSEMQLWVQRYKSFYNTQSEQISNFAGSLYAFKKNRQLKGEGNKIAEKTYYESVLPFQEAAREYDILCYPWNRAGNQEVIKALDELALNQIGEEMRQKRKEVKKMIREPFQIMDKNDIETFIVYAKNKCSYIKQNELALFKNISQWVVLKESELRWIFESPFYYNENYQELFFIGGRILCELVHRVAQEAKMETATLIWHELIKIANGQRDYEELIAYFLNQKSIDPIDIISFQEKWKDAPRFIPEKARKQIRDSFVSKYLDQNQKIEDFMEICFCCDEISYDVEEVCKLAKVFQQIFCFLQECVKKEDQLKFNAAEEILSIKEPLEKLKNSLGSESLMTDSLETSFVVNAKSNSYFKKVYEKRYVYLEYYIDNFYKQQQKEPFKEAEELAGRYLKGILKEDPKVRIKIKRTATEDIILDKLIKLLYPNLWHEDTQKLYDTKERLLNLVEKYGFVEEIWFEEEKL